MDSCAIFLWKSTSRSPLSLCDYSFTIFSSQQFFCPLESMAEHRAYQWDCFFIIFSVHHSWPEDLYNKNTLSTFFLIIPLGWATHNRSQILSPLRLLYGKKLSIYIQRLVKPGTDMVMHFDFQEKS